MSSINDDGRFLAGVDLSSHQYCAVILDANNVWQVCAAGKAAGGILQNKPKLGQAASVRRFGVSLAKTGGTFAIPASLVVGAGGTLIETSGNYVNTLDTSAVDPVQGEFVVATADQVSGAADTVVNVFINLMGAIPF